MQWSFNRMTYCSDSLFPSTYNTFTTVRKLLLKDRKRNDAIATRNFPNDAEVLCCKHLCKFLGYIFYLKEVIIYLSSVFRCSVEIKNLNYRTYNFKFKHYIIPVIEILYFLVLNFLLQLSSIPFSNIIFNGLIYFLLFFLYVRMKHVC